LISFLCKIEIDTMFGWRLSATAESDVPRDIRGALLRAHGSFPQAFSATYQSGLAHFGDARGFIAYKRVWGTAIALADPVAPRENFAGVMERFVERFPDAAFYQISRPVAEILAARNFFINELGPEIRLDLASYTFSGRSKQNLRSAINRAVKLGYVVRESAINALDRDEIKAVSDAWRSGRPNSSREVSFATRPMVFEDEPDVRAFFLFDTHDRILGFSIFDPIYEAGRVVGYLAQQSRHRPDIASLADYIIKARAIEAFRREGRNWLDLGLAPIAYIEDKDFAPNKNWLVRRTFKFVYNNALFNRFFYPLQGLELHKRQYRGVAVQTYFAFNTLPSLPRIIKILRASDVI
jgi:lysylphosphatidylglycerol synthetase-like protein (DUF2156 family)